MNILELGYNEAKELLNDIHPKRGKAEYLDNRILIEKYILEQFKSKGGIQKRKYPVYMSLGESTYLEKHVGEYFDKYSFPISIFNSKQISITYSDSMFSVHKMKPQVFLLDEIELMYDNCEINSPEVQVWDDKPLLDFIQKSQ